MPKNETLHMEKEDYGEIINYLKIVNDGNKHAKYLHTLLPVITEEEFILQEDKVEIFYFKDNSRYRYIFYNETFLNI